MSQTTNAPTTEPFRSRLDREVAAALAATEYQRFADLLESLEPDQWSLPTSCPGWTVRDMAGHCLGMAQMAATVREMIRQQLASTRAAKKSGRPLIDELTDLQVRKNAGLTTEELIAAYRRTGPRAVASRRRTPGFVRSRRLTDTGPDGNSQELWEVAYVVDTILTRDPWMHRADIAEATGLPMTLSADHDGVIVADAVADWALRHGRPFELTLTGPAGGSWSAGSGGETITADAVDFCRGLSGRGGATEGLTSVFVPF
jgi:uncharacterized protein (TIGR03083 family)